MDLNLKGKVVLITGAAGKKGSIGETVLQALAKEGAIPAVLDIHERGHAYVQALQEKGIDALFVKTDVCDPAQLEAAVKQVVDKYQRIDVVINHVGVNDGVGLNGSYEAFMQSLKLNLVSYFLVVKYALPSLKASRGNILNVGSKVALTGQGGTSAYAAAKGGVLALTREWATELSQYGIRSNAILIAECWTPAYEDWLNTLPDPEAARQKIVEKIPLQQRMSTPMEIANTLLFLISDRSSHTTGQFVHVDGGYVHLDRALLNKEP